jgi:RAD54-like protein 2
MKTKLIVLVQWHDVGGVLLIGYEMFRAFITQKAYKQPKSNNKNNKQACIDIEEEDRNNCLKSEVNKALLEPCLVICDEGHRVKNSSANIAKTLKSIITK